MNDFLILGPLTVVLTVYLIHRFRAPAEHIGLVDVPGGRKLHAGNVPLVGGIGIFVAFAFTALLLTTGLQPYRPLFACLGLLLMAGVLDDLHDIGAREKFGLHLFAALVLVFWGGLQIEHLGRLPLLGWVDLGWMAVPFTLICVVGLINAVNMFDGADGLAGGMVLSALFWFSVIGVLTAPPEMFALPILLACAVFGFLLFNFPHPWRDSASVFMGDSGSTMLGFALGWFAIELAFKPEAPVPPVTIAWVLALPIFDTIVLMLRRLLKGQSPMAADREHLHHIFERAGFSVRATACTIALLTFVMGGIGVGAWWFGVPQSAMWVPLLVVFGLHLWFVQHAWRAMRLLRRLHSREVVEQE